MELQEAIRRRRMVRSFEDRPIARDVVERILRNAQRAPSAGFSQGQAFLVLDGLEETKHYWDAMWPADVREAWRWPDLFNAPLIVVVLSSKEVYIARYAEPDKGWTDRDEKRWPVPYWDIDAGMAAMIVLLDAVDAGLGALFFGMRDIPRFRASFGVPETFTPIGVIAIGHPKAADQPSPSLARGRKRSAEVVHRGRW